MKKFVLLMLLFASCQKLKYGNVVAKNHSPEYDVMMLIPQRVGDITMMTPMFFHYNESWSIDVKGISEKQDTITKTFYVSKQYYDSIEEGNFICVVGMCDDDTSKHKVK